MSDTVLPQVLMDGKELLRALMRHARMSAGDFALRLGMPKLQGDIQAYLDGELQHPSWASFKPVAKFFNIRVSALFDAAMAEQVAQERGFMPSALPGVDIADIMSIPPRHLAGPPAELVIPIYDVVVLLAAAIKPHDNEVRKAVGLLFTRLLNDTVSPEETLLIAAQIEDLL